MILSENVWSNLDKMSHGIFEENQIKTWASDDFIVLDLVHAQLLWQELKARHLEKW